MFKAALKILKESFAAAATPVSKEKQLYDALRAVEAMRQPLKKIAPVTEKEDLRLACASGFVESWSFDDFVAGRLKDKGWDAAATGKALQEFQNAAARGRLAFENVALQKKDDKAAAFILAHAADVAAVAKELKAMQPDDMKDVPRTGFWA